MARRCGGQVLACAGFPGLAVTNFEHPYHPYMDHWWVPGLTIGYEHTVAHAIADCLNGVQTGTPAEPTFRPALRAQRVCEAISSQRSPAKRARSAD